MVPLAFKFRFSTRSALPQFVFELTLWFTLRVLSSLRSSAMRSQLMTTPVSGGRSREIPNTSLTCHLFLAMETLRIVSTRTAFMSLLTWMVTRKELGTKYLPYVQHPFRLAPASSFSCRWTTVFSQRLMKLIAGVVHEYFRPILWKIAP